MTTIEFGQRQDRGESASIMQVHGVMFVKRSNDGSLVMSEIGGT